MKNPYPVVALFALASLFTSCNLVEQAQDWKVPHDNVSRIQGEFAEWWAGLDIDEDGDVSGETLTLALPSLVGRIRAVLAPDEEG